MKYRIEEKIFQICVDGIRTSCKILVQEELEELAEKRCSFIVRSQQYHGRDAGLNGAYLIYDNEEGHIYYGKNNNDNAGRERVGMGLLIAEYLQARRGQRLEQSLRTPLPFHDADYAPEKRRQLLIGVSRTVQLIDPLIVAQERIQASFSHQSPESPV